MAVPRFLDFKYPWINAVQAALKLQLAIWLQMQWLVLVLVNPYYRDANKEWMDGEMSKIDNKK